jgi:beta-lactamase superfamily II metal-dependent hydrolase
MTELRATLIDVGWGDSILLQSSTDTTCVYGLIDSNDTTYNRSSFIFLKKFFERTLPSGTHPDITFDFVLLSHAHADHGEGLKGIMREFGTRRFWYPKSLESSALAELVRYARRSSKVLHQEVIDDGAEVQSFGDARIEVLWPKAGEVDEANENNNSVVLGVTLGDVSMVLGGDAETVVWSQIGDRIPATTRVFKVPHHGSRNGTLDANGASPWADHCPVEALLGISAHKLPFGHPHGEVIRYLQGHGRTFYRTDLQYHLTFCTDGTGVTVEYTHT